MRTKEKCPGLREQSQGHKDKFTALIVKAQIEKVKEKL